MSEQWNITDVKLNQYLSVLISEVGVKVTSIYFFQFIVLITLIKFLFTGSERISEKKELQKIIGGLTVFIVAILSGSEATYLMSFFIGGLIIASEDFMKFIFAVWKTDPKKIDRTVQSFIPASQDEVEKKRNEEVTLMLLEENNEVKEVERVQNKYGLIENKINVFFQDKFGERYMKNVKVENQYGSMVFDGAIRSQVNPEDIYSSDTLKHRSDLGFNQLVEIKFFQEPSGVLSSIRRVAERLSLLNFIVLYKIVIVVEGINQTEADKLYKKLTKEYSKYHIFQFYIFSLENNEIHLHNSPEIVTSEQ